MARKIVAIMAAVGAVSAAPTAGADGWVTGAYSDVRLIAASPTVGTAKGLRAGLEFRLKPGWKIFWRSPGAAGVPPVIDWSGSRNVASARLRWPAPERFVIFGLVARGYSRHVVLPIDITPAKPGEAVRLAAYLRYQVCSDICVPGEAKLSLHFAAGAARPGADAALIARWVRRVPLAFAQSGLAAMNVDIGPEQARPALVIRVDTGGRRLRDPRLILETPRAIRVGAQIRRTVSAGARAIEVWLPAKTVGNAALAGAPVTITLIDGDYAVERRTHIGARR